MIIITSGILGPTDMISISHRNNYSCIYAHLISLAQDPLEGGRDDAGDEDREG